MKKKRQTLSDLPRHLQGFSQNKYGGYQTQRLKVDRRNTFGAANEGRKYTKEEIEQWLLRNPL
jgi:hypothetical protein